MSGTNGFLNNEIHGYKICGDFPEKRLHSRDMVRKQVKKPTCDRSRTRPHRQAMLARTRHVSFFARACAYTT